MCIDWGLMVLMTVIHGKKKTPTTQSEDDGMGGRRKKGIKEKLPVGHKDNSRQDTASRKQGHVGMTATGAHGTPEGAAGEKKGLKDKIKDKLPGQH